MELPPYPLDSSESAGPYINVLRPSVKIGERKKVLHSCPDVCFSNDYNVVLFSHRSMKYTIDDAQRILARQHDTETFPLKFKERLEAVIDGTLPEFYLAELRRRRNYSDDLPEPDVPPTHPDYSLSRLAAGWDHPSYPNLKCRGNCIIGTTLTLQDLLDNIELSTPVAARITEFRTKKWNYSRGAKGEYWTLPEEITYINETLDMVIAELDKGNLK